MSLSTYSEINAYYLDSEFGPRGVTVTHQSAGPTRTGCRGTWETNAKLDGEKGSTSLVEVQTLQSDDNLPNDTERIHPAVTRAVKRLRTVDNWPETDNWPMIERGLLCLARANTRSAASHISYIAMEYYPNGNLRDWLSNSPPQGESWAREVVKQVLSVLSELAVAGLAHRNIKPSNILIASVLPIRIKLGDFHNAKWAYEDNGLQTQVGTLPYVAPEMRRRTSADDPYTAKVDMWALGIILYEILAGAHPFCEPGRHRFSDRVYERNETKLVIAMAPAVASAHAVQFVKALLERNPVGRPSPAQALAAPWFVQLVGQI
ncbi:Protein kinase protein rad53 [Maublancomyces gigas]|uniref:Protein kinase protein rad53 n=1 Tax=Discina gigas TaxID=1032678 RepID=A0ABR3GSY2_9PEZI